VTGRPGSRGRTLGLRRHPSRQDLAARFDGEARPGVDDHLAGCARCQAWTGELRRVRAAVRGEPLPAAAPGRQLRPAWAHPALAVVVVAALLGVAGTAGLFGRDDTTTLASRGEPPAIPSGTALPTGPAPAPAVADGHPPASGAHPATDPSTPSSPAPPATTGSRPPSTAAEPSSPPAASGGNPVPAPPSPSDPPKEGAAAPATTPLRLAVVTPADGLRAGEGADVVEAARRAVAAANRSRGTGGRPVELVVVKAEDQAGIDTLPGRADALVGGFGLSTAPGGLAWVFPADPAVDGPGVIRAEQTPAEVGSRLGADLATHRPDARVGVIVAGPAEAPMADGLARSVAVERVDAPPDTPCDREVAQLRRRGVDVLAVAGPPGLARRCAAAARTLGRPSELLLLLPSAAYDRLEADPAAQGARTFLGLPWPTSDEPGARRFRAAAGGERGVRSYRALVTFAAVEAAVESEATTGSPAPSTGRHRSDLYDIDAGANRAGSVVRAGFGRWAAAD
jgi:ABC-type branched-subunit amino acid transport system substrate-binding protein